MAELIAGMFNASPYKRSQGKMARQLTFAAMAVAFAVGAWKLSDAQEALRPLGSTSCRWRFWPEACGLVFGLSTSLALPIF